MRTDLTPRSAAGAGGPGIAAHSGPFHVVQFAFGSAEISREQARELERAAEEIPPGSRITVEGYTCIIGPKAYNDRLALERASAVAQALSRLGVPREAIRIEGHGKCCYVDDNDTKEGRARNRRAEIHVLKKRSDPK